MFGGVNHLNLASIGHNCIKELTLGRCYWLLRSYTGNWGKIGPQEPSHCKIRHNTDPGPTQAQSQSQSQSPRPKMANTAFSHDVTCAIFVSQNNEKAVVLAFQTSPVGFEPSSCVKHSFVPINLQSCHHASEKALNDPYE